MQKYIKLKINKVISKDILDLQWLAPGWTTTPLLVLGVSQQQIKQ